MAVHTERYKSDDQHVELGINNTNFTASSSSSLSSSNFGSPSTSLEAVGAPIGHQGVVLNAAAPRQWVDSEEEAGELEADWSSHVSADILHTLSDTEKRRQEIINEIYQTEKNHVRTLRLLEGIFMRPLQESQALTTEHFTLLFPSSLLVLKDLHTSFEQQLKQRRVDHGPLVNEIGDLLLAVFDGSTGDKLLEHAAQFCARQKIALEALKEKRRKDEVLHRLLTKAEAHKACRRLQLKDLLPTVLQRLTKYPLLFESLLKITANIAPDNEKEAQAIQRALELSRRILNHVNQAVREAEDAHTLQTIQKRLDKSLYEKEPNNEFKHLDLTQHKLIYDGPLVHKKQPREQLHGLLFETMVVLLHKQDDKYILKHLVSPVGSGESKNEVRFNPITKINLILVRQSAVEKNSFYLINTNVTQMLELTAPSALECKTWFNHISAAAEAYKQRTKTNHEMTPIEDPATVTIPNSSTKESIDSSPDNEFVSAANTSSTSASANPLMDNSNHHYMDDQKEIGRLIASGNGDANSSKNENDHINGNGSASSASDAIKSNENDVCDSKANRHKLAQYSNNSNNTRTLTQQSSLVAPSEVHISISPALTAEPVLTPNERLRRLDESIRATLAEKQKIVCDIFRVPNEHFSAIADIAGQPEAPKEPSDILLAAFAQVQSLTETLNDYIKVPQQLESELLLKSASLCDDCYKNVEKSKAHSCKVNASAAQASIASPVTNTPTTARVEHTINSNSSQSPTTPTVINNEFTDSTASIEPINTSPDDDGYCEIDEIRLPAIIKSSASADAKQQSLAIVNESESSDETLKKITDTNANENKGQDALQAGETNSGGNTSNEHTDGNAAHRDALGEMHLNESGGSLTTCDRIRLSDAQCAPPSIPCHLISNYIAALNLHISQLLPKLNERDIERERLRKENQLLRDRLSSIHERQQFSSELEQPENGVSSQDPPN